MKGSLESPFFKMSRPETLNQSGMRRRKPNPVNG